MVGHEFEEVVKDHHCSLDTAFDRRHCFCGLSEPGVEQRGVGNVEEKGLHGLNEPAVLISLGKAD